MPHLICLLPYTELHAYILAYIMSTRSRTDGGAIHTHKTGVPTLVMSVPARHIHSHSSIIHRDDYDHALTLLTEVIKRLSAEKVAEFIA